MKIFKIIFSVLLSINAFSQNPIWILPPYSIATLPLPLPLNTNYTQNDTLYPYDYYDGSAAQHASNMVMNDDGSICFFVIDGLIYDTEGKYIDYAWSSTVPNIVPVNNPANYLVDGKGGNRTHRLLR